MKYTYVTFGQTHAHSVNGKIFHKDVVARIPAKDASDGRAKAFKLFDGIFAFEYFDKEWDESSMKFYPGGYVDIDYQGEE